MTDQIVPVLGAPNLGLTHTQSLRVGPDGFAARLNRLFVNIHPPGRGPSTSQELVRWLERRGSGLSAPYLSQLRTGQRDQPSLEVIELISEFFGVRSDYFTDRDEAYRRGLDRELEWLTVARDPVVRRLTTALVELDDASRAQVMAAAGI